MTRWLIVMMLPLAVLAQNANPNRDYAGLRADVDALREQQKMLYSELLMLRQELDQRDARIKKAVALVDALDKRMTENDAAWKAQITEILKILDKEHNDRVQSASRLEEEMKKQAARRKAAPSSSGSGEYALITVEKGDTLGGIAKAAKVSVEEIRRVNNLTGDTIYLGQKLKIPVVK